MALCWNVYYESFNERKIKTFNVFDHGAFYEDCLKAKRRHRDDKEGFAEEVRRSLMYYFWSKCEWEIVLTHWPDGEIYELRERTTVSKLRDAGLGAKYTGDPEREVIVKAYTLWSVNDEKKIDVYEQVMNNWQIFIDYLWDNRKELRVTRE